MKNKIFLLGLCVLLFTGYAFALQNSVGFRIPADRIRIIAQVTVPEDMKLVLSDGTVVGDEICIGDTFSFQMNTGDGEYWQDAGTDGDPPIHWAKSDLKAMAESVTSSDSSSKEFRELLATETFPLTVGVGGACLRGLNLTLGEDNQLPAGTTLRTLMGGITCKLNEKNVAAVGAQKSGDYYTAQTKGEINFNANYDLDCLYYHTTGRGDLGVSAPFAVGLCGENTPLQPIEQSSIFNVTGSYDNFNVGKISFSKRIKVVDPGTQKVEITVIGGDDVKMGEEKTLKVLVKNTGDVDVSVKDLDSKAVHRFIACDATVIKPGSEAECLLSVTPGTGNGLDVQVSYSCKICGRTQTSKVVKNLISSEIIKPASSAQAYSVEVTGDCTSQYYSCDYPDKSGTFYAGYSCYNTQNKFFSSGKGRFDLKYVLPQFPSKEIISASLKLFARKVNEGQNVALYAREKEWNVVSCAPEGDICMRPYCKECADIYDGGALSQLSTLQVNNAGRVSFDVTGIVKDSYAAGKSNVLFTVGGEEGFWESEGKASCNKEGDWTKKDVEFAGKGEGEPYLEILYK